VCIHPAIQRIYERAVAKDPSRRFANIEEMAATIRAIGPDGPLEIAGAACLHAARALG
jgi:hypothetical protein